MSGVGKWRLASPSLCGRGAFCPFRISLRDPDYRLVGSSYLRIEIGQAPAQQLGIPITAA